MLRRLKEAGYLLIVVTNQPRCRARYADPLGSGTGSNTAIGGAAIDEFLVCAHDDAANCACRKPKTRMVLEAAARHAADLHQEFPDRRPLARYRLWRVGRCAHRADRPRLPRASAGTPGFVAESLDAAAD